MILPATGRILPMKRYTRKFWAILGMNIMLVLIPVFVALSLFPTIKRFLMDNARAQNSSTLRIVSSEMDRTLERAGQINDYLLTQSNVTQISYSDKLDIGELTYLQSKVFADLRNFGLKDNIFDDVLVYYPGGRKVISQHGAMDLDLYISLYLEGSGYGAEEISDYLDRFHYNEFQKIGSLDKGILISSNADSAFLNTEFQVCCIIDMTRFLSVFSAMCWDPRISIQILDDKNDVIATVGASLDFDGDCICDGDGSELAGDKDVAVFVEESSHLDWRYVAMIPDSVYNKDARTGQFYFTIILVFCTLFGAFLSFSNTKRVFSPLQNLMKVFGANENTLVKDEYIWLNSKANAMIADQKQSLERLEAEEIYLRKFELLRLLEHAYLPNDNEQADVLHFAHDCFQVVLLALKTREGAGFSKLEEKDRAVLSQAVCTLIQEFFQDQVDVYCALTGENLAIVFDLPDENHELQISTLDRLQQKLETDLHVESHMFLGGLHQGKEGIYYSHEEARALIPYISLLDEKVLDFKDIDNKNGNFEYSTEQEQKIINAIRVGKADDAMDLINAILESNCKKRTLYEYQVLLFNVLGTLMKVGKSMGYSRFLAELEESTQLSTQLPVEEIEQKFAVFVKKLCDHSGESKKARSTEFIEEVELYLQEKHCDTDLNISTLAEKFDITPSYLSALYKKRYGKSLLQRLNELRIATSLKLLEGSDTIADIAVSVGFRDSNSYIRVFRNVYGITPGQMRSRL
jgi:AraC-like DNA-binding protein